MKLKVIQYFSNQKEKHEIQKEIKRNIWSIYEREYSNMDEADAKVLNLANLIQKAEEFNERTITEPINTKSFTKGLYLLEQRIEDDYFQGALPVK